MKPTFQPEDDDTSVPCYTQANCRCGPLHWNLERMSCQHCGTALARVCRMDHSRFVKMRVFNDHPWLADL